MTESSTEIEGCIKNQHVAQMSKTSTQFCRDITVTIAGLTFMNNYARFENEVGNRFVWLCEKIKWRITQRNTDI